MEVKVDFKGITKSKKFEEIKKISYFEGYVILVGKETPVVGIFPKENISGVYFTENITK